MTEENRNRDLNLLTPTAFSCGSMALQREHSSHNYFAYLRPSSQKPWYFCPCTFWTKSNEDAATKLNRINEHFCEIETRFLFKSIRNSGLGQFDHFAASNASDSNERLSSLLCLFLPFPFSCIECDWFHSFCPFDEKQKFVCLQLEDDCNVIRLVRMG